MAKNDEHQLEIHGVDRSAADELRTHRLIAAAVRNPGQSLSVEELARTTRLTERVVQRIVTSEEFRASLAVESRFLIQGLIGKCLQHAERLADQPELPAKTLTDLLRTLGATYKSLGDAASQHDGADAENQFAAFLNKLRPADFRVRTLRDGQHEAEPTQEPPSPADS